jgi:hypothetical protein
MKYYSIEVYYSLAGNAYPEKNTHLNCCRFLYSSFEEAVKALANDIEIEYNNKDYRGLKVNLPKLSEYGTPKTGYFTCAYTFGPKVTYECRIVAKEIFNNK